MDFSNSPAFERRAGHGALVLDSPHSGADYPIDFGHACPLAALRVEEDTQVDRLWQPAAKALDATLIAARFPRTYIDPNRALADLDPTLLDAPWPDPVTPSAKVRLGKGLVWRTLDKGTAIYERRLTVAEVRGRIAHCWRPYHAAVAEAVDAAHARHGRVLHLNCHSMPSVAGPFSTDFPYTAHPDFVIGDRDGTTADPLLTRRIETFLYSRGHTVGVNHPYKGVELVRLHGRPADGRHSIQLEINKRLYLDEATLQPHEGFEALQRTLQELAGVLNGMLQDP